MGQVWSEENKYQQWLAVELAAAEALSEFGEVPQEAAQALREHAAVDLSRIQQIEQEVRHDVIAFTTAVAEILKTKGAATASRWLHFGLTSNDVVDTAQALLIQQANAILLSDLGCFLDVLRARALEFRDSIAIGRTHGVHAEPITFGLKLALWFDEGRRARDRLEKAAADLRCGKVSGAVGTLAHISPEAEDRICGKLGLTAAPIASQVISRDRHAAYVAALALACALCEKVALEVRHLQRTKSGKWKSRLPQVKKAARQCPTSEIRWFRSRSAVWRAWSAPMFRRQWKISLCGMSATSPIPRWSA
jgi:adenylosuccinate lyase